MLGQALNGLGPFGAITFLGGIGVGCWLAIKASQTILKAYYFALFTLVGAALTMIIAFAREGHPPQPAAWIAASLAFGGMAVMIRAKIVKAISIGALLLASYWLVGQKHLPGEADKAGKKVPAKSKKGTGTSKEHKASI